LKGNNVVVVAAVGFSVVGVGVIVASGVGVDVDVPVPALDSNMELVWSGWKKKRSERKGRMRVSRESGLLESSSEAVEKLPESGETVKKERELSGMSK